MQFPSHALDMKRTFQLKAPARPALGICNSSPPSRVHNLSEPAGKMWPQTFAQICLLSQLRNLNRCLPRAAMLMEVLCQNTNKKKALLFSQNACSRAAQEWKTFVYFLRLLVEEGSVFPLPALHLMPHCLGPLIADIAVANITDRIRFRQTAFQKSTESGSEEQQGISHGFMLYI